MSDSIISDSFFHHLLMEIYDQLTKGLNGILINFGDACIFQADYIIAKNIFNQGNYSSFWVLVALIFSIYEPSYYLYHKKFITIENILVKKPWAFNLLLITFFVFIVDKLKVFRFFTPKISNIEDYFQTQIQSIKTSLVFPQEVKDFIENSTVFSGKILYTPLINIEYPAIDFWNNLKDVVHMYDNSTVPAIFNPNEPNKFLPTHQRNYLEIYNIYPELRQNLIYHNIKTYARKPLRIFWIKTVELYKRTVQHVDKIFRRWGPYASLSKWYANAYNSISRLLSSYLILTNSETTPVDKVLDLTLEGANAVMDVMLINNPIANTIVTYVESHTLYEQFIDWKQGLWDFFQQTGIFINAM